MANLETLIHTACSLLDRQHPGAGVYFKLPLMCGDGAGATSDRDCEVSIDVHLGKFSARMWTANSPQLAIKVIPGFLLDAKTIEELNAALTVRLIEFVPVQTSACQLTYSIRDFGSYEEKGRKSKLHKAVSDHVQEALSAQPLEADGESIELWFYEIGQFPSSVNTKITRGEHGFTLKIEDHGLGSIGYRMLGRNPSAAVRLIANHICKERPTWRKYEVLFSYTCVVD